MKKQQNLENVYVRGIEFLALRVVLLQPSVVVDRDLIFNFVEIIQVKATVRAQANIRFATVYSIS